MKKKRIALLMMSILIMAVVWGIIALQQGTMVLGKLEIGIFILIVALAVVAFVRAIKKDKEAQEGQPADDELSNQLKYKAGYYSFMASMYMWLFIFLFKEHFPDIETMVGGGILLMGLIAFISKLVVRKEIS